MEMDDFVAKCDGDVTEVEAEFFRAIAEQEGISLYWSKQAALHQLGLTGESTKYYRGVPLQRPAIAGGYCRDILLRGGGWSDIDMFFPIGELVFSDLSMLFANSPATQLAFVHDLRSGAVKLLVYSEGEDIFTAEELEHCVVYFLNNSCTGAEGYDVGTFMAFRGAHGIKHLNVMLTRHLHIEDVISSFPVPLSRAWLNLFPTDYEVKTARLFDRDASARVITYRMSPSVKDKRQMQIYLNKLRTKYPSPEWTYKEGC